MQATLIKISEAKKKKDISKDFKKREITEGNGSETSKDSEYPCMNLDMKWYG